MDFQLIYCLIVNGIKWIKDGMVTVILEYGNPSIKESGNPKVIVIDCFQLHPHLNHTPVLGTANKLLSNKNFQNQINKKMSKINQT